MCMKKTFSFLNKDPFVSFEKQILLLFRQAPTLPKHYIDWFLRYNPTIALILGLLGILSITFSMKMVFFAELITLAGALLSSLLLLFSYSDLKAKRAVGWQMVFWSANIGLLTSVFELHLVRVVVGALVSWFVLTQIRKKYH